MNRLGLQAAALWPVPGDTADSAHSEFFDQIRTSATRQMLDLGTRLADNGHPDQAIQMWERVMQTDPGNDGVCIALMRRQLAAGQTNAALTTYQAYQRSLTTRDDRLIAPAIEDLYRIAMRGKPAPLASEL